MRTLIAQALLTFLLCTSSLLSMETEKHPVFATDDIRWSIFTQICPIKPKFYGYEWDTVVKTIKRMQSVCKTWQHAFNPVNVRKLMDWDVKDIVNRINRTHFYTHDVNDIFFLMRMLQDQPNLINIHRTIAGNSLVYTHMALTNGANPNFIRDGKTPLLHLINEETERRIIDIDHIFKMIRLLLKHGASIYGDAGNGSSIANMLLKKSFILQALGGTSLYACLLYFLENKARKSVHYDKIMPTLFSSSFVLFTALMSTAWGLQLDKNWVYYPIITAIIKEKYGNQLFALGCVASFFWGHFNRERHI